MSGPARSGASPAQCSFTRGSVLRVSVRRWYPARPSPSRAGPGGASCRATGTSAARRCPRSGALAAQKAHQAADRAIGAERNQRAEIAVAERLERLLLEMPLELPRKVARLLVSGLGARCTVVGLSRRIRKAQYDREHVRVDGRSKRWEDGAEPPAAGRIFEARRGRVGHPGLSPRRRDDQLWWHESSVRPVLTRSA